MRDSRTTQPKCMDEFSHKSQGFRHDHQTMGGSDSRNLISNIKVRRHHQAPQVWHPKILESQMVDNGFNPADHHPTEFVEFCTWLESIKPMLGLSINKTDKVRNKRAACQRVAWMAPILIPVHQCWTRRRLKRINTTQMRCHSFAESKWTDNLKWFFQSKFI